MKLGPFRLVAGGDLPIIKKEAAILQKQSAVENDRPGFRRRPMPSYARSGLRCANFLQRERRYFWGGFGKDQEFGPFPPAHDRPVIGDAGQLREIQRSAQIEYGKQLTAQVVNATGMRGHSGERGDACPRNDFANEADLQGKLAIPQYEDHEIDGLFFALPGGYVNGHAG